MNIDKAEKGRAAEDAALLLYLERGARLLERNYRAKSGELDLILEEFATGRSGCAPGEVELVFVEVRSRAPGDWVGGLESVDGKKLAKIRHAMKLFLADYTGPATRVRLDILAWDGQVWERVEDVIFPVGRQVEF